MQIAVELTFQLVAFTSLSTVFTCLSPENRTFNAFEKPIKCFEGYKVLEKACKSLFDAKPKIAKIGLGLKSNTQTSRFHHNLPSYDLQIEIISKVVTIDLKMMTKVMDFCKETSLKAPDDQSQ